MISITNYDNDIRETVKLIQSGISICGFTYYAYMLKNPSVNYWIGEWKIP